MTTDERLDKLEKELARAKRHNRRLLAAIGLAAGAFALVWIVAGTANRAEAQAGGVPAVIRAGRFELVDVNGKTRAFLDVDKDGAARVVLIDENGKHRAMLCARKYVSALYLSDENGKTRAFLPARKSGSALYLSDENDTPRVVLSLDKDGPGLSLFDVKKGKGGARLTIRESGPWLCLLDENGRVIWQAP